jgi:hypothetical protein
MGEEYILYLDANNLYGYAMCEYLPMRDFEWNKEVWTKDKIMNLDDNGEKGYLFEVSLKYPEALHDLHNGYACAPEKMQVKNWMLNEWQQINRKEANVDKLCTTFYDKKKYGINYRLLKLYLSLGLEFMEVHRVIQYKQCDFMKSYIMKNTNERKKAKNDFEKDFYKLMNNSVFGKTMENVRNRINYVLIDSVEKADGLRNRRKGFHILHEKLVGVLMLKKEVKLNKPIYIGYNVLDQSKYLMYDFHYNFMLRQFVREDIDLLFPDTDSLCYNIRNRDPYEVMEGSSSRFDLSDYPTEHKLYNATNKKVIGKFKDETNGLPIIEFVALRSKVYSFIKDNDKVERKCKGVKKAVQQSLQFPEFKDCLLDRKVKNIEQATFRSYRHQLFTEIVTKKALAPEDDKCYVCDDNIHTFTLGHYKTRKNDTIC